MAKTAYEMNKQSMLRWREKNKEHYAIYHKEYAADYYRKNKDEINRKTKERRYKQSLFNEQCEMFRNICLF